MATRPQSNAKPGGAKRRQAARGAARETKAKLQGVAGDRAGGAQEFDRLVHERMRLGMLSALAVNDRLSFNQLKQLLSTSDGNLSVHSRKLEEAGYIQCRKSFEGRLPKTEFELTAEGRVALERYLDHMEALIAATRAGNDGKKSS